MKAFKREYIFVLITGLLCLLIANRLVVSIILGALAAFLIEDLYFFILKKTKIEKIFFRQMISVFLVLIVIAFFMFPLFFVLTSGISQFAEMLKSQTFVNQLSSSISTHSHSFVDWLQQKIGKQISIFNVAQKLTELFEEGTANFVAYVTKALASAPVLIVDTVVFLLTWVVFLAHGKFYRSIIMPLVIPWERERKLVSNTFSITIKALFMANLWVSIIQATFLALGLLIFEVPNFLFLGSLGFFLSFVPFVGTPPIFVGAAAWCYFSQNRPVAAIFLLILAVVVGSLDNFLRPMLMRGRFTLKFYWIFIAIVGGIMSFGVFGALLGPLLFALFQEMLVALNKLKEQPID